MQECTTINTCEPGTLRLGGQTTIITLRVLLHVHGMCIPYKALCMGIVWAVGIFKLKYRYRIRSIGRFDYRGGGLLIVGTERSF